MIKRVLKGVRKRARMKTLKKRSKDTLAAMLEYLRALPKVSQSGVLRGMVPRIRRSSSLQTMSITTVVASSWRTTDNYSTLHTIYEF